MTLVRWLIFLACAPLALGILAPLMLAGLDGDLFAAWADLVGA